MINLLYNMLGRPSVIDLILKTETKIEVRNKPAQLFKQLQKGGYSKFIAKINQKTPIPLLGIRKLCLVHYILIHYPDTSQYFQAINLKIKTEDSWLNENIIKPYSVFLYKIINQIQPYCESKLNKKLQISYKLLFYLLNILKDLFPCVKKMSNLSRYYINVEKELKSTLTTDYISIIAYQAQKLYNCFKAVLGEMVSNPQKYISTQAQKMMMKTVIQDQLPKINEQMKNLFLDKYYFPYGKGFEQDLNDKNRDLMQNFQLLSQKHKNKKQKKMTLDKLLFGDSGRLNPQVMMSLSHIRQCDQSVNNSLTRSYRMCMTDRFAKTQQGDQFTQNV